MRDLTWVRDRLWNMLATPGMWGSTNEAFGLQVILLGEVGGLHPQDAVITVFGLGPQLAITPLDDEWAEGTCRRMLHALESHAT